MNLAVWIQQLPVHIGEALSTSRGLLTRHGLRTIVLAALLVLTAIATSVGLTDLIRASEAGEVQLIEYIVVSALAMGAIMTMWLALEFAIESHLWWQRILAFAVYLMLVLWSIGFGFGFYWKHIASVIVARDEVKEMTTKIDGLASGAELKLSSVRATVDDVARGSREAQDKEETGNSCSNVPSGVGKGNLYQARNQIAGEVEAISSDIQIWITGRTAQPASSEALPGAVPPPSPSPSPSLDASPVSAARATATPSPAPSAAATPLPVPAVNPVVLAASAEPEIGEQIRALRENGRTLQRDYGAGTTNEAEMRNRVINLSQDAQVLVTRINAIIAQRDNYRKRLEAARDLARNGAIVGGETCQDAPLSKRLDTAIDTLDQLTPLPADQAVLDPKLGARATQDAFFRLWNNVFPFLSKEPPKPFSGQDVIAIVAAVVVDIGICFLTLFGRNGGDTGAITGLVSGPLPARLLRRRLFALVNAGDRRLRDLFDRSLIQDQDACYLVASEQLPAIHGALNNLQIMLRAARLGSPVSLRQPLWDRLRGKPFLLLDRLRRALAGAGQASGEASLAPADFDPDLMTVLRLTPQLTFAIQRLLGQSADQDDDDAGSGPGPAAPPGGEGPSAP